MNTDSGFVPQAAGAQALLDLPPNFIELLPVAAYACNTSGRILWFNRRAAELWGRTPRIGDDSELFCGSYRLYFGGRQISREETPMAAALRSGAAIHGVEGIVERPDGSRIWVTVHIDPVMDEAGNVVGAINCFHDTTELHEARAAAAEREAYTRRILDAMPVAIYTTDAAGQITYNNEAAARLAGREPTLGSDEWCVTWKLFRPDGTPLPHDQCPMALALKDKRPNSGMEAIAERPDGTRVPFLPYPTPLFDASGKLTGAVNMLVDITERKAAEEALRESEARLRAVYDGTYEYIGLLAPDGTLLDTNRASLAFGDYAREDVVGRPFWETGWWAQTPGAPEALREAIGRAAAGEFIRYEAALRRPNGETAWFDFSLHPVRDARGNVVFLVPEGRDITGRKRIEQHRELLINELNHRVKNTLATVQSFASQTLRNARTMAEARATFEPRLMALAKAHDVLTREHWEGARLHEVVSASIAAYSGAERAPRFHVDGPDLRLRPKSALALSMALHELATNAVKYGALSNGRGTVTIGWQITRDAPSRFRLRWAESGGPPVEKPHGRGFGSRLVERGLAQDLAGEVRLDFERPGLICAIDAPLAELVVETGHH